MTTTTKTNATKKDMKELAKKNPKLAAFLKEQEQKAKAEADRIANLKGFDKLVHDTEVKAAHANARVKEIEKELAKVKDAEKEIRKEIQHMKAIQKMAEWTKNNSMKWYKEEQNAHLRDQAWKYYWKLKTAVLDLYIIMEERTDMKKFKYAVSVSGHSISFTGDEYSYGGGTYSDHDAIKKVAHTWAQLPNSTNWGYVPHEDALEPAKKFSKLEDAEAFAKKWMELIEKHYKAELKKDRGMLKQAKAGK